MTGWPAPPLMQDSSRPLFKWFASKPDARRLVRERCEEIRREQMSRRARERGDKHDRWQDDRDADDDELPERDDDDQPSKNFH